MDHIEFLRKTRRLPGADQVRVCLAPAKENTPEPEEGERVVFRSHFLRGIGLPASAFFCSFLEFYQLQLGQDHVFHLLELFLMSSIISLDHEIVQLPDTIGMLWVYQTSQCN